MAQEITVSVDTDDAFAVPARYSIVMLALIAGYRVRFIRGAADLHYGPTPADDAAWLPASPDAHQRLLRRQPARPAVVEREAHGQRFLSLFPTAPATDCATDIVAAAFFFLSLHEQWTSAARDQFDRFPSSASLLGARGELQRPVLSEYAAVLRRLLEQRGLRADRASRFGGRNAAAVMTHDIDYLSKFTPGLLFRETVKNFLFNRRHVGLPERLQRLREYGAFAREEQDPYVQSIHRMLEVEQRHGIVATWLFKAGGRDKRDVSYSLEGSRATRLLAMLREAGHDIGLHPSFHAHADAAMLRRERQRLERATGEPLRSVRQHYLRFLYPQTWRQQCGEAFEVDTTLGFAEAEGFRNGTCHPFLPWDLEEGRLIPIWEAPLTVMDGTLAHYQGLDPAASAERIALLLSRVSDAGGMAVLLFHNTAYDRHDFPGWGEVFEDTCSRIADGRFATMSLPDTVQSWLRSAGYGGSEEVIQVINTEPA